MCVFSRERDSPTTKPVPRTGTFFDPLPVQSHGSGVSVDARGGRFNNPGSRVVSHFDFFGRPPVPGLGPGFLAADARASISATILNFKTEMDRETLIEGYMRVTATL